MTGRIGARVRSLRLLLLAPLLTAAVAVGAPAPAEAAFACTAIIDGGTIKNDLVVPAGESCVLGGTVVRGGVTVASGAELIAVSAEIRGSVVSTGHSRLGLFGGVIRGGVSATGGTESTQVSDTEVRGSVMLSGNTGFVVGIGGATVRGSVTFTDNHVDDTVFVANNTIAENLACADNAPPPTLLGGAPNTVGGAKSGQCAGL